MSLTRTQIENWDASALGTIAAGITSLTTRLEGYFDQYVSAVTMVNGRYWEGRAAEAALDRAHSDRRTIQTLADDIAPLVQTVQREQGDLEAALRSARGQIALAGENGFPVAENLKVTDPSAKPDDNRKRLMQGIQDDLTTYSNRAEKANNDLVKAINDSRDGLRVAFTSPQTLGTDQGRADGTALAAGQLSPEQGQRLIAAGTLTPEQLAAQRAGEPVTVPASQLEYINQLSRSLDGKSPQQIQELMDKLPPDQRQALAQCFQIGSTQTVTASVTGDPQLPNDGHGGLSLLPKQIQQSLTRTDLVTTDKSWVTYDPMQDPLSVGVNNRIINLNGVADNEAIAKIAGVADPRYRMGSDLNRKVLDVAGQYLHAEINADAASHGNIGGTGMKVDGEWANWENIHAPEHMFSAVGDDKFAVRDVVTDSKNGEQFIHDVLANKWDDHGQAASTLFRFGEHDAFAADPSSPGDQKAANNMADIMSAVGKYVSTDAHLAQLTDIQGSHQSFGQANTELAKTIAHSMSPYAGALVGDGASDSHVRQAFRSWIDPGDGRNFHGAKNVFELLDTNEAAGLEINGAAQQAMVAHEIAYAQNPGDPNAKHHLLTAGRLDGVMDAGLRDAANINSNDKHLIDMDVYNHKSAAYDAMLKAGTLGLDRFPGSDAVLGEVNKGVNQVLDAGGPGFKEVIIGKPPTEGGPTYLGGHDFQDHEYVVVKNADIPASLRHEYPTLFDGEGQLKPWDQISADGTEQTDAVHALFGKLGDGDGQMKQGYDPIVTTDPAQDPEKNPLSPKYKPK